MGNNTAAVFTRHYDSPMGRILLAADEIGLRGLWFDGQKYFARDLPEKRIEQETHALPRPGAGWTYTLPAKNRTFCRRCTPSARRSARPYGQFFCRSPTGRPRPTARSRGTWPGRRVFRGCPRRPSAVPSGITKYRSSFPATALSAQAAV